MKKIVKTATLVLSFALLLSSCIGSFALTNRVKEWNENIGNKFVNELVFIGLHIIPVYEVTILADVLVLNSIEFWTGENPSAQSVGDTKIVKNAQGEDVTITVIEDGYTVSNGETAMNLLYDKADNSWNVEFDNCVSKLLEIVDDNNAVLYTVNGGAMNVSLDADGVELARRLVIADYAMK